MLEINASRILRRKMHFDPQWRALPDYNRDTPADPFRPYGATIGHWFEWARKRLPRFTTQP